MVPVEFVAEFLPVVFLSSMMMGTVELCIQCVDWYEKLSAGQDQSWECSGTIGWCCFYTPNDWFVLVGYHRGHQAVISDDLDLVGIQLGHQNRNQSPPGLHLDQWKDSTLILELFEVVGCEIHGVQFEMLLPERVVE